LGEVVWEDKQMEMILIKVGMAKKEEYKLETVTTKYGT
jgi:hypothetical protein